jgi:acyl-[acyl carrier protein]--UDP-N-acetylglucosamine O-acyltransferase
MALKKTYTLLYNSGLNFSQAKVKIKEELGENNLVQNVLQFLESSKRGIIGR